MSATARTSVFWDIKTYPVPRGCDAGAVGRCINRYLRKLGYCGPLNIVAVGLLTDVPDDVLRAVSTTGITLNHVPLGSIGILRGMNAWKQTFPAPANMMLISSDYESIIPRIRHSHGYNICRLIPDKSRWIEFLLQDSGEDEYSKTPESIHWICSVCSDHFGQGYENFTTHLSSREHKLEATRVEKEAVGLTLVIWDIWGCPVPPECDARRVSPCIKQYLKDFGYSGPLTITAAGPLREVNQDVMRAVSSTGIMLNHVCFDDKTIFRAMYRWSGQDPRPANIMVIWPYSPPGVLANVVGNLKSFGFNVVELFPYNSPYSESLWKKFLLEGSVTLEDECSETGEHASWLCSEDHHLSGQGYDNFITHLYSQEHEPKPWLDYNDPNTKTVVFWDIKAYPVPPGRDVGLRIKQYLKDLHISGPLTINLIGLTDVPLEVLLAVSSTGIILKHGPSETDSADILYQWASLNPPPAIMVVICPYSQTLDKAVADLLRQGYRIILPFRFKSSTYSESPWEHFRLGGSVKYLANLEEEDDSWVCSLCHDISGKGFEKCLTHLSQKHGLKSDEKDEETVEDGDAFLLDSLPGLYATANVSEEATKGLLKYLKTKWLVRSRVRVEEGRKFEQKIRLKTKWIVKRKVTNQLQRKEDLRKKLKHCSESTSRN